MSKYFWGMKGDMMGTTRIFLDGGDPIETKKADELLKAGGLSGIEGQTTNPSLIAKSFGTSSDNLACPTKRGRCGEPRISNLDKALQEYRRIVTEIAQVITGPISIQVTAHPDTSTGELLTQARDRIQWIPNGVIKFPCTKNGLAAASVFCEEGPVNITLVFTQEQAAAVYAATKSHNYDVYVSPFVGRLDDRGENGMDVVCNILEMFRRYGDGHVNVLTASTRTYPHLLYSLFLKSDIVTLPLKLIEEWSKKAFEKPNSEYIYRTTGLSSIPYRELTLENEWQEYDIHHDLTDSGVVKFWEDWTKLV